MNSFIRKISSTKLVKDQRGISFMEYSVLLVLVLIVCIGAWKTLGGAVQQKVQDATQKYQDMENAEPTGTGTGTDTGAGTQTPPAGPNG